MNSFPDQHYMTQQLRPSPKKDTESKFITKQEVLGWTYNASFPFEQKGQAYLQTTPLACTRVKSLAAYRLWTFCL